MKKFIAIVATLVAIFTAGATVYAVANTPDLAITVNAGTQSISPVNGSDTPQATITGTAVNFDVSSQTADFDIANAGNKIKIENPVAVKDWTVNIKANAANWTGATYTMPEAATFKLNSFDVKDSTGTTRLSLFETQVADAAALSTVDTTIIASTGADVALEFDHFWIEGLFIQQTIPAAQEADSYTIGLTLDLI